MCRRFAEASSRVKDNHKFNYMKKTRRIGVATVVAALSLLALFASCVNEKYQLSEDRINLEVTVFQDGLSVPLGSTARIMLKDLKDSLLNLVEDKSYLDYFSVGEDGAYALGLSGSMDLSDTMNNILAAINVPDIEVAEKFAFNLNSVDVSSLKVPASEYSYVEEIGDMISAPDFSFKGLGADFEIAAGLYEYALSDDVLQLDFPKVDYEAVIGLIAAGSEIPSELLSDVPVSVDQLLGSSLVPGLNIYDEFGPEDCHMSFSLPLPEGISSVEDVVLDEGAKIRVTVELINSIFTDGVITPYLDLDIHEIFHLTDEENEGHDPMTMDHILADFVLDAAGGEGAKVVKEYSVKSLVFSEDDWSVEDGCLTLHKEIDVRVLGSLGYEGVKTTTRHLAAQIGNKMKVKLHMEFVDFRAADVRMTFDPVTVEVPQETISFQHSFALPEQIGSIDHIALSEESKILISVVPKNVVPGLKMELESLRLTLPEGIEVEGAHDGVLSYSEIDLSQGYAMDIRILDITLPQPKDGKMELDKEVTVDAVVRVGGTVSSADFPENEEDDLMLDVAVKADLEIEDYSVTVTGYEYPVDYSQEFEFDVTGMEEFGTLTVLPAGNPEILVDVVMPETGVRIVADPEDDLVISFPHMLHFKDLPKEYNYDKAAGTITFKGDIPSQVRLPLDRLVLTPVKEDGKYWAKGEFKVSGGIAVAAGSVSKADVDALTAPGCAIGMTAIIPEIRMETLAMDKPYEKVIEREFEVSLLSADVLPSELAGIERVEFEDVYFTMELDASQLPDLGPTRLGLDFELKLPDIMILESDNLKDGNVLSVKGDLDKDGMIRLDPVKVVGLNMSGLDLDDPAQLKDTVSINGKVVLDDISLDIDEWLGKTLEVKVAAGIKDIVISKLYGQVDVGLPPMNSSVDLTVVKDLLVDDNIQVGGLENLLSRFNLMADIKSNIGIPMGGKMVITPYFAGEPDQNAVWSAEVNLDYTQSAADTTHTRLWLSPLEKSEDHYMPEGFEHIYFPFKDYVKSMPDSLKVFLDMGSDVSKVSVIEPTQKYLIDAAYAVNVPLEFGDGAYVTYRDTIPEIPEIVGQLLAYGDLLLTGQVTALLPFEISMKVNLLDSDGKRIQLDEASSAQQIIGCSPEGEPAVTDLQFGLKKKPGVEVKDVSAIELEFKVMTVSGVPLSDNCFIQASLQALVPDGVTVDAKELMNGGE